MCEEQSLFWSHASKMMNYSLLILEGRVQTDFLKVGRQGSQILHSIRKIEFKVVHKLRAFVLDGISSSETKA